MTVPAPLPHAPLPGGLLGGACPPEGTELVAEIDGRRLFGTIEALDDARAEAGGAIDWGRVAWYQILDPPPRSPGDIA